MRAWVAGLLAAALVGACSHDDSLKRVQARGELVVVSRNGPTTWYEGPFGPEGLEYTLASRFAEHLGVRLRMVQADSIPEMFAMVQSGRADLAAAGITVTPERQKFLLFGAPYLEVREMVVCRRGGVAPRSLEDLEKQKITLVVAAGTSYVGTLAALRRKHPKLAFVVDEDNETVDLLRMVWERKIPCTVADSTIADAVRRFLPELAPRFALTEPRPIAWAFAPKAKALRDAAARWIEGLRARGALARIRMRYFGHLQMFDYVDTRRFLKATVRRLPPLRPIFEAAAKQTGFPWTLLAAQAWVESQWDPYATSPTGVRG
ncbi:MAG: membrane-bound lytic murein transglycosylase MltF, partial [Zetaproteobacteria bacterium]